MNDAAMPDDPITMMADAAAQLHELFLSYVKAGFSRKEALYLVGQFLVASSQQGSREDPS